MDFARNRQGTANDCPGRGEKGFKLNSSFSFSGKQWKTKRNVWESMGEDIKGQRWIKQFHVNVN